MADATQFKVSLMQAEELVMDVLKPRLVPMLVSDPGLGKSALARQLADKGKLKLIDIRLSQCDPADLNGFPWMDPATGKASYRPMDVFPLQGDPIPDGYVGWLLLLDELNSASKSVEAASYKILLDRMVGMHKLHERCLVMGAGNLKTSKAIVNDSGTAQQSRIIWLEIQASMGAWLKWADTAHVDHRVKSYLQFRPEMLHKFDPNHTDRTFPCPRTWEFMSKIINPWPEIEAKKLPVMAGTVGAGPAREFYNYCQIFEEIPSLDAIIADPENVHFGNEPSMHYALAGLCSASVNETNAEPVFKFLGRLAADFQVSSVRGAIARDRKIMKTQAYKDWYADKTWDLVYYDQ